MARIKLAEGFMRKGIFSWLAVLAALVSSGMAQSQNHLQYFGYWANNGYQHENYQHTNITHIWTGDDRALARDMILAELAQAKANNIKAIISVPSFVFNTSTGCPYKIEPSASSYWASLVNDLVAGGYLVPGNPDASTVAAFYTVDEPELCGLSDQGGMAHPAIVNALNAIRSNPATSNFPIAVIGSTKYGSAIQGIRLYDWAGMDCYHCSSAHGQLWDESYLAAFNSFRNKLDIGRQRTILVPQSATGGPLDNTMNSPEFILRAGLADDSVIMILPFLWGHHEMRGLREHAGIRDEYIRVGHQIKYGLFSSFVSQSVPATMSAGRVYSVTVHIRNTGRLTWPRNGNIRLGSQNPGDNTIWGMHRVALQQDVAPGQVASFSFNVRAPSSTGTYNFQWRMVADGQAWFGEQTPNLRINVVTPPSGSISASPNPCPIYAGQSTCTTQISWNSNKSNAEVWVSRPDGSNPQLFARAQSGRQNAGWIGLSDYLFTLKSSGEDIASILVVGVQVSSPPEWEFPPTCPGCDIP